MKDIKNTWDISQCIERNKESLGKRKSARQKIMDPFNAMNNSSALSSVLYPAPIISNVDWRTYGFAEDGTWYVVGQPPLGSPTF